MGVFSTTTVSKDKDNKVNSIDRQLTSNQTNQTLEAPESTNNNPEMAEPGHIGEASVASSGEHEGKSVEIVINGPLGYAYTQALNLLLGKEDMASSGILAAAADGAQNEESIGYSIVVGNEEPEDKAYVYVTDASAMNLNEMNQVLDEIDLFMENNPTGEVVVGFENAKYANPQADRLLNHLSLGRSLVLLSRDNIIKSISNIAKRHGGKL